MVFRVGSWVLLAVLALIVSGGISAVCAASPQPVLEESYSIGQSNSPFGDVVGNEIGINVTNTGGGGDVYYEIYWKYPGSTDISRTASRVFWMDAGESVRVYAVYSAGSAKHPGVPGCGMSAFGQPLPGIAMWERCESNGSSSKRIPHLIVQG